VSEQGDSMAATRRSPVLRGAACMSASAASSAGMNGLIRVAGAELHSFEIAFFRNLFGLAALAPMLWRRGRLALATNRLGLHALRGVLNAVAMLAFFHAVTFTPLAQVAALGFTAPLFGTILAIPVLGERVGSRRWAGLAIGFLGALVILRPGVGIVDVGGLFVLLSSLAWAGVMMTLKLLGRTESSLVTTTYASLFLLPITGLAALFVWQTPDLSTLLVLVGIGALGSLTQISVAQAFREADATVVMPFDFTKLIWAALIGYLAFDEQLDLWTVVGATMICGAVTFVAYREARAAG